MFMDCLFEKTHSVGFRSTLLKKCVTLVREFHRVSFG